MNAERRLSVCLMILTTAIAAANPARGQCQTWQPGHSSMGVDNAAFALCAFDDGSGPAIYAGGVFQHAGGNAALNIARWDGFDWTPLGAGVNGTVHALAVFDDGSGPALYVGGDFSMAGGTSANHIARWSRSHWSQLGVGTDAGVDALTVFDDGSGPALYAGGGFSTAGGGSAAHVAKWNGLAWSPVGAGADLDVYALTVFDDGSGAALYAGGIFQNAGGSGASYVAKWDGLAWSPLAAGTNDFVLALGVFDDGSGPALYAGGGFTSAGGGGASHVARWNGSAWSALGSGLSDVVDALGVFDDGTGPALYAGGDFHAPSAPNYVAKWNGSSWAPLATGTESTPHALLAFDDGTGPALFVAGAFSNAGGVASRSIVKWDGSNWAGVGSGADATIFALRVFDDGSGPALYAAGNFSSIGAVSAKSVAKWNGTHWTRLGSGMNNSVRALAVFDDGSGPALYAAGSFTMAGGVGANRIAKWDGSSWAPLGTGFTVLPANVYALATFDDGSGTALYAGGEFSTAGGQSAHSIAKWNGSTWSSIGSGASGGFQPYVLSLGVFDDGSGPALYVGGGFTSFSGVSASGIVRWNGTTWSALGSGVTGGGAGVYALATYDDGSGPALFVGGLFSAAGGNPAASIARWNGSWSALGAGVVSGVEALGVFDDGSGAGAQLYATGSFLSAGGGSAAYIASWNGSAWSALGAGLNSYGHAIAVFDDGSGGGPDLFVAGEFTTADSHGAGRFAQWTGCGRPGVPMCFGDGSAGACPCANSGTALHGCNNSAATGGARLVSAGWTSLSVDTLKLTSSSELANAFSVFLQGNAEIAPTFFGDGLRCAGGSLRRLYVKQASGGVVSAPQPGDLSISARSAALGDAIGVGGTRIYQVYYRDPSLTFCPSPLGNTWNVSSGLRIEWLP